MKEGPRKRDILSRPASKKVAARPRSAPRNEPKPVPVPLPEGVRHQRVGETTEHSAHLEKLKQLFAIRWAQRRHRRPIDDEMRRNLEDLVYISP